MLWSEEFDRRMQAVRLGSSEAEGENVSDDRVAALQETVAQSRREVARRDRHPRCAAWPEMEVLPFYYPNPVTGNEIKA